MAAPEAPVPKECSLYLVTHHLNQVVFLPLTATQTSSQLTSCACTLSIFLPFPFWLASFTFLEVPSANLISCEACLELPCSPVHLVVLYRRVAATLLLPSRARIVDVMRGTLLRCLLYQKSSRCSSPSSHHPHSFHRDLLCDFKQDPRKALIPRRKLCLLSPFAHLSSSVF